MNLESWMNQCPDDKLLFDLIVPGSHNSSACYLSLPAVRCQGETVNDQIVHGIRYLDFRIGKPIYGPFDKFQDLCIYHGDFTVKLANQIKLMTILNDIYKFLNTHKSECFIISLKVEGPRGFSDSQLSKLLKEYLLSSDNKYWYLDPIDVAPQLKQVRGKCILLKRFNDSSELPGINACKWQYNSGDQTCGLLRIQDYSEVGSNRAFKDKIQYIEQLQKCSKNEQNSSIFLNYISASSIWPPKYWPSKLSKRLNRELMTIQPIKPGIMVLDFVDMNNYEFIKFLIKMNFKENG